jgi:hypothetical protein
MFLMLGSVMRFGRFGRPASAMGSSNAQPLIAEALRRRSRDWTCKG